MSLSRDEAQRRRQRYVAALMRGMTPGEAAVEIGVRSDTIRQWKKRFPAFGQQVDLLTAASQGRPHQWAGTFAEFREAFFGYQTYAHHQAMIDAIDATRGRRDMGVTLILVHPESGKTSLVTDYLCKTIGEEPNVRALLCSEREGHARKVLATVQRRMTDASKLYARTFGPFYVPGQERKGKPWAADYLRVWQADGDEKDYTLECRSITSAVQGTRTDLLIVDDPQSLRSLNSTTKMLDLFRQDFLSRVTADGACIVLGTRVGPKDFYEALLDEGLVDDLVELPALLSNGDPLCPEMWPPDRLERKRKQVGEEAWWRNWMQSPQTAGTATFTEKMLADADDPFLTADPGDGGAVILGLDPALGGGNALIACRYHASKLEVVDLQVDYGLGRTEEIFARVDDFAARYRPQMLVVETTAMQKGLARDDRLIALSQQWGFRVLEHDTKGIKADPILGVASMAGSFTRGEVRLAAGDEFCRRRIDPLRVQLKAWRPDVATRKLRQDAVMALWFVWRAWAQQRRVDTTSADGWKHRGLQWAPTAWGTQRAVPQRRVG